MTHDYDVDSRNASVLINVNGALMPRDKAVVSVFDSGFMLGDGVWEGLRLHKGVLVFLDAHLDRLYGGAKTLDFDMDISRGDLTKRLYETVDANAMDDHVHIRLMVTRGVKSTPYQDPRVTITPPTIVIIPEWKKPSEALYDDGISLFTVHVRRTAPDMQDQKLNSHSKLNCIQACIQATKAGADEALMLDDRGFVATCNSTHFFIVRGGALWTSGGGFCLGGITRANVISVARDLGLEVHEKDFSLTDVYTADEAFTTGTFAGLVPVKDVDGRLIEDRYGAGITARLSKAYCDRVDAVAAQGRDV